MKMTLNFSQFYDNWPDSRKEQFSYEALKAIFDYYEEYTDDTGEEIEFDPIAICCEWSEYPTALECATSYGFTSREETPEEAEDRAREWLEDRTTVLVLEKGIVIIQF